MGVVKGCQANGDINMKGGVEGDVKVKDGGQGQGEVKDEGEVKAWDQR